jgi:DNA repair exonuclease SbcCD ATPase subunit
LLLVLLAVFFPAHFAPSAMDNPKPGEGPLAQEIKEQVKQQLQPKKVTPKEQQARPKSQELENLEAQRDKLAQSKMDTREEAMDVVKSMSALEEQMQKRDKQLAQRADALKQQMKQLQRVSKNRAPGDGPASKMNRAVEQGDFQRADKEAKDLAKQLAEQQQIEDAIDKIEKKLKEGNLNPQEKEKLEKELNKLQKKKMTQEQKDKLRDQLKDLQEKIDKLARDPKERARELKEMAEKGLIDEEQLQRELDQLKEQMDLLDPKMVKGLEEVANKLRKSLEAMEKGDDAEAGRLLEEAVDKLAQLDPTAEREELKRQLQQLLDARRMLAQELENDQGGPGQGRRPDGKPHDTKSEEQRARSAFDKGALQVVDVVPGQGFKGPRSPAELGEEIRQATQAAPEAIDRQRLPQSASDMARGYFEKLRGPEKK